MSTDFNKSYYGTPSGIPNYGWSQVGQAVGNAVKPIGNFAKNWLGWEDTLTGASQLAKTYKNAWQNPTPGNIGWAGISTIGVPISRVALPFNVLGGYLNMKNDIKETEQAGKQFQDATYQRIADTQRKQFENFLNKGYVQNYNQMNNTNFQNFNQVLNQQQVADAAKALGVSSTGLTKGQEAILNAQKAAIAATKKAAVSQAQQGIRDAGAIAAKDIGSTEREYTGTLLDNAGLGADLGIPWSPASGIGSQISAETARALGLQAAGLKRAQTVGQYLNDITGAGLQSQAGLVDVAQGANQYAWNNILGLADALGISPAAVKSTNVIGGVL